MNIFLIGYMASGKTVVAEKLSQLLGFRFVDTDKWIEARCCKSIPEIFSDHDEAFFRKKEKECLEFLIDHQDIVIATGGGMSCSDNAIELMIEHGETVYLKAEVSTLISRLWNEKSGRPMIPDIETKEDLHRFISNHLSQREEYYKKCKHIVCVDGKSVEEISKEIKHILL
tara:strand:- start:708 stop:1220 length:513 start_codon:yes stop_codon:yes gene_type:complete